MYKLRNRAQMMLTINIPDEPSICMNYRETREFTEHQFNAPETQAYLAFGSLILVSIS